MARSNRPDLAFGQAFTEQYLRHNYELREVNRLMRGGRCGRARHDHEQPCAVRPSAAGTAVHRRDHHPSDNLKIQIALGHGPTPAPPLPRSYGFQPLADARAQAEAQDSTSRRQPSRNLSSTPNLFRVNTAPMQTSKEFSPETARARRTDPADRVIISLPTTTTELRRAACRL